MKKGNFRTKRIYPKKGEIRFVIQSKIKGRWKKFGKNEIDFTFETQKKADAVLISILDFGSQMNQQVKFHGIDLENLKMWG